MTSSETKTADAVSVEVSDIAVVVELSDGRTISAPLAWYPRLLHGSPKERSHWQIEGRGYGIHWPDLDEDISVEGLLAGRRSMEGQESLSRWLAARGSTKKNSK